MANRGINEQFKYETQERGLSIKDALSQMKWMFSAGELEKLEASLKCKSNECDELAVGDEGFCSPDCKDEFYHFEESEEADYESAWEREHSINLYR